MRLYRCKTGLGQRDGNTYEYANDAELRANGLFFFLTIPG